MKKKTNYLKPRPALLTYAKLSFYKPSFPIGEKLSQDAFEENGRKLTARRARHNFPYVLARMLSYVDLKSVGTGTTTH